MERSCGRSGGKVAERCREEDQDWDARVGVGPRVWAAPAVAYEASPRTKCGLLAKGRVRKFPGDNPAAPKGRS